MCRHDLGWKNVTLMEDYISVVSEHSCAMYIGPICFYFPFRILLIDVHRR